MIDTALNLLAPALVAMGWVAYRRRARSLRGGGRAVPGWRQACFGAGLGLLLVAEAPPLGKWSEELVTFHMVQHLAIGDLAALLIVLGLTGPLLRPILAARGLRWLRVLGNPLLALPAWLANLYLWHLAALYEGVLDHPALHLVQHAAFLGFGSTPRERSARSAPERPIGSSSGSRDAGPPRRLAAGAVGVIEPRRFDAPAGAERTDPAAKAAGDDTAELAMAALFVSGPTQVVDTPLKVNAPMDGGSANGSGKEPSRDARRCRPHPHTMYVDGVGSGG